MHLKVRKSTLTPDRLSEEKLDNFHGNVSRHTCRLPVLLRLILKKKRSTAGVSEGSKNLKRQRMDGFVLMVLPYFVNDKVPHDSPCSDTKHLIPRWENTVVADRQNERWRSGIPFASRPTLVSHKRCTQTHKFKHRRTSAYTLVILLKLHHVHHVATGYPLAP